MDISALMSTMLSDGALGGIGQAAGVSQSDVKNVLGSALPALLNGAESQAKDESTAAGFAGALSDHAKVDTGDLAAFLKGVDLEDGGKIVNHLLGGQTGAVADTAAQKAGLGQAQTIGILAAAAPLLMSLLGQQTASSGSGAGVASLMGSLMGSGDMGSILSGLLGGQAQTASAQTAASSAQSGKSGGLLGKLLGLLK